MEFQLLENADKRQVFEVLASRRKSDLQDLRAALVGENRDEEALHTTLAELKDYGLIEESEAPVKDYNLYYLTRDGFAAADKLGRIEPLLS